ncbi:MAG: response regulator [Alphaproteobacteria bacterium]
MMTTSGVSAATGDGFALSCFRKGGFRILVIEDDPQLRRFLRASLELRGYQVLEAVDGRNGADHLTAESPDLILLDLNLPDVDGLQFLSEIRSWSRTPVIVMSVRSATADKIQSLDGGASDYVTKPFDIGELLARINGVLRRRDVGEASAPVFQGGEGLVVDLVRREVSVSGQPVSLTRREFKVLAYLILNANTVLTHQAILRQVWGRAHENDVQYLRIVIARLRQKLEADPARPRCILTVSRVGYRLRVNPAPPVPKEGIPDCGPS